MILHPSHTPTHAPAQEARMTHILVIEDNPDLAFGLRNNLEIEGYEVTVAADGPSGLARALETSPDLVVLDLMLPGIDGYEVCRRLRESPATAATKVLVVTARAREAERVRGLAEGADAYITKPFSTRDLIAEVAGLLGRAPA